MDPQEKDLLLGGAADLGVSLTASAVELLLVYLDLIYFWNPSAKLTAIARVDAVRLHLLDSLALMPMLGGARTLVDLGSGAGLPGIPLAIGCAGLEVSLVESRRRKASFLAEAVRELGLSRCTVVERDARRLAEAGVRYDAVVGRAVLTPVRLVELAAGLVTADGTVFLMSGGASAEGLAERVAEAGLTAYADERFRLPNGGEQRRIVALKRAIRA